jgi:hypothetical protein
MQHSIINKTTSLTVLQNLDLPGLREKINNIQEGVHDLIYKSQNNIINSKKLANTVNNFNSMKSNNNNSNYNSYNFNIKDNQNPDDENERIR